MLFWLRSAVISLAAPALLPALRKALTSEKVLQKMELLGIEPLTSTPQEMASYWKSETARWHPLIKERGIKPE